MDLLTVVSFLLFIGIACVFLALIVIYITSSPPNLKRYESEKSFLSGVKDELKQFPSIIDDPTLQLTVVVPSYNEEERLPVMMDEAIEHLQKKKKLKKDFTYEIIVVDDGSRDKTSEVALKYTKKYGSDTVRVLTLEKNRGKGGAIRLGVFSARGRNILFADADGATKFSDLDKMEEELNKLDIKETGMAVICGSRAHLEEDSIATRSLFRTLLMHGFHFLVWFLCVRGIRDTQCGFKLLTRPAAALLFSNLHVDRWAFDVDLLYVAQCFNIPLAEVAVTWHEVEGTKMIPVWSWLQMGKDLLLIRLRYMIGAWKISEHLKL